MYIVFHPVYCAHIFKVIVLGFNIRLDSALHSVVACIAQYSDYVLPVVLKIVKYEVWGRKAYT